MLEQRHDQPLVVDLWSSQRAHLNIQILRAVICALAALDGHGPHRHFGELLLDRLQPGIRPTSLLR